MWQAVVVERRRRGRTCSAAGDDWLGGETKSRARNLPGVLARSGEVVGHAVVAPMATVAAIPSRGEERGRGRRESRARVSRGYSGSPYPREGGCTVAARPSGLDG